MPTSRESSGFGSEKAWRFSTCTVSKSERARLWRQVMSRLCLPIGELPDGGDFEGDVACLVSPLGIRFAVVEADAHKISGEYPEQGNEFWFSVLLKGQAHLTYDGVRTDLNVGDMIYGAAGGAQASLAFDTRFKQIFINAPSAVLSERIVTPMSQRLGYLPAKVGIRRVFSNMLTAIADEIDEIEADQLRPFDQSFMEYVIACVIGEAGAALAGDPVNVHTDNMYRICQTIELLLGNSELTLSWVAEAHGVTTSYIQERFAQSGRTFSEYVKRRRLERCRSDLVSPLFAQQSVAEICYRWGFSAPAHFSRVFRAMYGTPPSEYRRLELIERVQ